MAKERSPGIKLLFVALVGAALIIPLMMVYALVYDRENQAQTAQNSITSGWGDAQVLAGPLMVIPYNRERVSTEVVDGKTVTRTINARELLYVSPTSQNLKTNIKPQVKSRGSIHKTVIYETEQSGTATFDLPGDLDRFGVEPEQLRLNEAEIRFPISDPRGLQTDAQLNVGGEALPLRPGLGTSSSGSGVHAFFDWSEGGEVAVDFNYRLRGSSALSMVPQGMETDWSVESSWPHPSFVGSFLPDADRTEIGDEGFEARWSISNLALGQTLVRTSEPQLPQVNVIDRYSVYPTDGGTDASIATIRLVEPVDLYSRVNRSVKYGFLFIGFTFLAFLMFDIVGGARVSAAEYLLSGAGLVLFFVMLLAFAEMIGFALAYLVASAAIIGLLSAYSAAVLGSWLRARVIGALLVALYALLYVLLNLEEWSLVIGSVLLFFALAAVMYATRQIDWSSVNNKGDPEPETFGEVATS